jgi:hypothetical protein
MTAENTTEASQPADESGSREDRNRTLRRMWIATANAIIASLENPEAAKQRAAHINVARAFLADNHVDNEALDRIAEGGSDALRRALDALPEFNG